MKYLIVWYQKVTIVQNLIRDGKTQYIQLYDNKNKQEINKKKSTQHGLFKTLSVSTWMLNTLEIPSLLEKDVFLSKNWITYYAPKIGLAPEIWRAYIELLKKL